MAAASSRAFELSPGDGVKTVYVRFRDTAGNTTGSYNDTISLDTTPPTGWFTVNGGAKETSSNVVTVKNYVTGATKYRVDTGAGYGAWTPYAASFTLTLPGTDGLKTVAIQYSDDAGNVLNQATTITLVTPVVTPAPRPARP